MKIDKKEKYTLLIPSEKTFEDFADALEKEKNNLKNDNLIIDLNDSFDAKNRNLTLFVDFAIQKKENGTSLIIVDTSAIIDDYPETFNISPTLQEAEDILEMEEIERSLGF